MHHSDYEHDDVDDPADNTKNTPWSQNNFRRTERLRGPGPQRSPLSPARHLARRGCLLCMSAAHHFPTRTARRCVNGGETREREQGANITQTGPLASEQVVWTAAILASHLQDTFFRLRQQQDNPRVNLKGSSPLVAAIPCLDRPEGLIEAIPVKVVFPNQRPLARNNTERDEEEEP